MEKYKKGMLLTILVVLIVGGLALFGLHWFFYDISHISKGEQIGAFDSPDGEYTLVTYVNNDGATVDFAVLGCLINNNNGKERNIYWEYHKNTAIVYWEDNNTVVINGNRIVDVETDNYDYRHAN